MLLTAAKCVRSPRGKGLYLFSSISHQIYHRHCHIRAVTLHTKKISHIFQSVRAQHNSSLRVRRPANGETVLSFSCGTGAKPSPRYEKSEIMPEDSEVPCEAVSSWTKCPIFNHCPLRAATTRLARVMKYPSWLAW